MVKYGEKKVSDWIGIDKIQFAQSSRDEKE